MAEARRSMGEHVRAMLDLKQARRGRLRLRQQHPRRGAEGRGARTPSTSPASCPPTSGRCSARARGRSAGSLLSGDPAGPRRHRRRRPRARSRRTSRSRRWIPLARERVKPQGLPGAHLLARLRRAREAGPRLQRARAHRRGQGADRHRPRPPRRGLGGLAESRDRGDEGRLRRGGRLADPERAPERGVRRDLGLGPPRRRRRHGLLDPRRHGGGGRRHPGGRGPPASASSPPTPAPASMRHADAGYERAIERRPRARRRAFPCSTARDEPPSRSRAPDLEEALAPARARGPPAAAHRAAGRGQDDAAPALARAARRRGLGSRLPRPDGRGSSPERFVLAALDVLPAEPLAPAPAREATEIRRLADGGPHRGAATPCARCSRSGRRSTRRAAGRSRCCSTRPPRSARSPTSPACARSHEPFGQRSPRGGAARCSPRRSRPWRARSGRGSNRWPCRPLTAATLIAVRGARRAGGEPTSCAHLRLAALRARPARGAAPRGSRLRRRLGRRDGPRRTAREPPVATPTSRCCCAAAATASRRRCSGGGARRGPEPDRARGRAWAARRAPCATTCNGWSAWTRCAWSRSATSTWTACCGCGCAFTPAASPPSRRAIEEAGQELLDARPTGGNAGRGGRRGSRARAGADTARSRRPPTAPTRRDTLIEID